MFPLLFLVPVATSALLGVVYLVSDGTSRALKIVGVAVFACAVYLQFFAGHALFGMLLQIGLALSLAVWRKGRTA